MVQYVPKYIYLLSQRAGYKSMDSNFNTKSSCSKISIVRDNYVFILLNEFETLRRLYAMEIKNLENAESKLHFRARFCVS